MQGIDDYPRYLTLQPGEVYGLLTGSGTKVSYGLEMIFARSTMSSMQDPSMVYDISDIIMPGSSVSYDNTAKIGGTATLVLDPATWEAIGNSSLVEQWVAPGSLSNVSYALYWGNPRTRLRPYMVLSGDNVAPAKFYLGVYIPATPQAPMNSGEPPYTVTCYDQTSILDVPITAAISYASGQNVANAINALIAQFEIGYESYLFINTQYGSKSASNITVPMSWGIDGGVTYLDVINALLAIIGFYPLWADCYGALQITPWLDPRISGIGWTFDATDPDQNIVDPNGTWTPDVWGVPNTWIFLQNGLAAPPTEGNGQYTITNTNNGPSSISRQYGRVVFSYHTLDAASQADLVTQGNAIMLQESQYSETFAVNTSPMPLAGHADVVYFISDNIPPNMIAATQTQQRRCNVLSWQLPLDGSDMTWSWGTIG